MAFALSPAVQIERDPSGNVRSLNHLGQPYGPLTNVLNPQKLAESYLGRTQEPEFYARQALIALENDACQ